MQGQGPKMTACECVLMIFRTDVCLSNEILVCVCLELLIGRFG
jgi:hypothetical protein